MKKELLAPAGDFETLKQAIHHGADAVYLGGKRFGARKFASNFDEEEMKKAISYCHLFGVKIYVTVNTMIYEEELEEVLEYVSFLYHHFVDAIIVQDLGLISMVRKKFPNLEIHASTQLHNHNRESLRLLEELGVTRVVVAREMSLEEINQLDTSLEIECFIHGAMCVCYSGQCLFSSLLLSRSGNRGECAGICRLPFQLLEDGGNISTNGNYLLSPRELNSMGHIPLLMESKVTSFKIEGRMKSPTTIGFIVSLYRKLMDGYLKQRPYLLTKEDQQHLLSLFNREFTDGFLFNSKQDQLMNIKSPNHIGYPIGRVVSINNQKVEIVLSQALNQEDGIRFLESETGMIVNFLYDSSDHLIRSGNALDHVFLDHKVSVHVGDTVMKTLDRDLLKQLESYSLRKIPVQMQVVAHFPQSFILTVHDGVHTVKKEGAFLEKAAKTPTTEERVLSQLKKTGDTCFAVSDIQIDMDSDLFIPISLLNELRRQALEELQHLRENDSYDDFEENVVLFQPQQKDTVDRPIVYTALVRTKEQLLSCMEMEINEFYTPDFSLYQEYKDQICIYYRPDRVNRSYPIFQKERILASDLGAVFAYGSCNDVVSDYFLNVANSSMVHQLNLFGVKRVTLSIECSVDQVQDIVQHCDASDIEVILYGHIEAMITKYCPVSYAFGKEKGSCNCCHLGKSYSLRDRNGAIYPLIQSKELTHIFYHTPIERNINSYRALGIRFFRFEFLHETATEVRDVIKKQRKVL